MFASRVIKYFAYAILLFGYLIFSETVLFAVRNTATVTFHLLPYYLAFYLIQILFGALLGLEQLIGQFRQSGRWRVNVEKIVFLGLPPLAFYAFWLLTYGLVIHPTVNDFLVNYVMGGNLILGYAGVVLGYTLVTAFQKSKHYSMS
jgi:uncharacterized integral membrane protein